VRKTKPKLDVPFKCYIYCTKSRTPYESFGVNKQPVECGGKVIGEFVCDKIIQLDEYFFESADCMEIYEEYKQTCLSWKEINEYAKGKETLYGWHISNLVIYDEPKELGEFSAYEKPNCCAYLKGICLKATRKEFPSCSDMICDYRKLKIPFQSWGYVEELGV
jgi:predicted transcriptional regulator